MCAYESRHLLVFQKILLVHIWPACYRKSYEALYSGRFVIFRSLQTYRSILNRPGHEVLALIAFALCHSFKVHEYFVG